MKWNEVQHLYPNEWVVIDSGFYQAWSESEHYMKTIRGSLPDNLQHTQFPL